MTSAILVLALALVASEAFTFPPPDLRVIDPKVIGSVMGSQGTADWSGFKKSYNKVYKDVEEELHRFRIFLSNALYIQAHNAEEALDGRHGYELGVNEFADMTNDEFRKNFNGMKPREGPSAGSTFLAPEGLQLPDSVDWRTKGYVTEVKNQGQCGSCWAFSTTGSLEGQHFKKTGKLVSLSEQNLVDCAGGKYGNEGCSGGLMDQAFSYIKDNGGVDTEASYPYQGRNGKCQYKKANVGATDTGFVDVKKGDESDLQKAIASAGPVAVAIDASHITFQLYRRGVYNPWFCSSTALDHGVLAVGYGTDSGKDYWIVKNSWGKTWGNQGYIWMARNSGNKCGIATSASYPLV